MNAAELSEALRKHKAKKLRPPARPKATQGQKAGRRREVTPEYTENEILDLHRRHVNGESLMSLAYGNKTISVYIRRAFIKRGLRTMPHKGGRPRT